MTELISFERLQKAFAVNIGNALKRPCYAGRQWNDYFRERQVYMTSFSGQSTIKLIAEVATPELRAMLRKPEVMNWINKYEIIYTLDNESVASSVLFTNSHEHDPDINKLFRIIKTKNKLIRIENIESENPKKEPPALSMPYRWRSEPARSDCFFNPHEMDPKTYATLLTSNFFGVCLTNSLLPLTLPMFEAETEDLQARLHHEGLRRTYRFLARYRDTFSLNERQPRLLKQEDFLFNVCNGVFFVSAQELLQLLDYIERIEQFKPINYPVTHLKVADGYLPYSNYINGNDFKFDTEDFMDFAEPFADEIIPKIIESVDNNPKLRQRCVGYKHLKQTLTDMRII